MSRCVVKIISLIFVTSISGCSTLFNRGPYTLELSSEPSGATIKVENDPGTCTTPCSLELNPKQNYQLIASFKDFEDKKATTSRRPTAYFWVNILAGAWGLAFMALDWSVDKMWVWESQFIRLDAKKDADEDEQYSEDVNELPPEPQSEKTNVAPMGRPPNDVPLSLDPKQRDTDSTEKNKHTEDSYASWRSKYPESRLIRRAEWLFGRLAADRQKSLVACVYKYLEQDQGGQDSKIDDLIRKAFDDVAHLCMAP